MLDKTTSDWREELRELGFGNQAVIRGAKRVELFDVISSLVEKAESRAKGEALEQVFGCLKGQDKGAIIRNFHFYGLISNQQEEELSQ